MKKSSIVFGIIAILVTVLRAVSASEGDVLLPQAIIVQDEWGLDSLVISSSEGKNEYDLYVGRGSVSRLDIVIENVQDLAQNVSVSCTDYDLFVQSVKAEDIDVCADVVEYGKTSILVSPGSMNSVRMYVRLPVDFEQGDRVSYETLIDDGKGGQAVFSTQLRIEKASGFRNYLDKLLSSYKIFGDFPFPKGLAYLFGSFIIGVILMLPFPKKARGWMFVFFFFISFAVMSLALP